MDAAKQAVNKIIGRSGHHDTEVHESVNPAVTQETVKPHRHEETTQAVDREVHQDHYHTTVQPLQHQEVLPEKHTHQQMPVQEKEVVHGDSGRIRSGVEQEAAKFADSSTTHQTTHSTSQAPVAAGEHVHHHVHETVQPVIHKETLQPEVVHTTVPIHETHHAQAEHHGMSTLPTKTLSEFKELGGKITGGAQRHEEYEGHPRPYNPDMQSSRSGADVVPSSHDGLHDTHDTSGTTTGAGLSGHGTNVSGLSSGYDTGSGPTSGGMSSTGTALGGRVEGNTGSHTLDAATSHGSSGIGSESTSGQRLEHSATGRGSTSGAGTHDDRGLADTSSSTNTANTGAPRNAPAKHTGSDDVQSPSQGKDPSLVESNVKSSGLKGEGVDGSHSAVFGLTPDGHKHTDTAHGVNALKPAHTKLSDNSATGDTGSRAVTGTGVAEQMHDPRVAEKGHDGSAVSTTDTAKPGAGVPGGEQGFGTVRPNEHGSTDKIQNKLDPTTDADGDGKKGIMS